MSVIALTLQIDFTKEYDRVYLIRYEPYEAS